jgi:hypothetical protein
MELRGMLRASVGGASEPITVLQLNEAGCTIESTRPLDLGIEVEVEVEVEGFEAVRAGVVMSSNELQLVYGIRFVGDSGGEDAGARD